MERKVIFQKRCILALASLLLCGAAHANSGCSLTLKPETRGFFLNPILEKVTVVKVTPMASDSVCPLKVDDEILQINDQLVVGQRANSVMNYWKSLKRDEPRNVKVKRGSAILTVATK